MPGDARANRSGVTVAAAGLGQALLALWGTLGAATASGQIVFHEASDPDIEWQRDLTSAAAELTFSADGEHLILWHNDGRRSAVATFDAASGTLVRERTLGADRSVRAIAVSSTGRLAAAAQDFIDVFDLASGEPVFGRFLCEGCDIAALAFSPDGTKLAMQDWRRPRDRALGIGVARILDLATRRVVELEAIAGSRNAVSFAKDGSRLLTAHVEFLGREEWLGFRVWDIAAPTLRYTASFPRSTMGAIATGAIDGARRQRQRRPYRDAGSHRIDGPLVRADDPESVCGRGWPALRRRARARRARRRRGVRRQLRASLRRRFHDHSQSIGQR